MFLFGRTLSIVPRSELGFARAPMPSVLVDPPVRTTIAAPGTFFGRSLQREAFDTRREVAAPAPPSASDRLRFSPAGAQAFNIFGSLINNLARVAVIQAAGPAAPIAARVLPPFRIIPPVTTLVAQPQRVAAPAQTVERSPADFAPTDAEAGYETRNLQVTQIEGGRAVGTVDTVQGRQTFEFDVPFPEAGF